MQRSAVQWQVSLIRGFGQYFIEVMEGSDDSNWGPVFSIWNLLMIALFGFITKKIYDCIGNKDEKAPNEALRGSTETSQGSSETSQGSSETQRGFETTRGSTETSQGSDETARLKSTEAGSTLTGPTKVEDVHEIPLEKQATGGLSKERDASGKIPGTGSSVDGKEKGAEKEMVSVEKAGGLKSQPSEASSGWFGRSSDPVMKKVEEITDEMKEMSNEELKKLEEQEKNAADRIEAQMVETMATGRAVDTGIEELQAETEDFEKAWNREQEEKRKREEEERKKNEEEAERKRKEELKKEEEERKRKEEELKKEAERKRKEEEEAERKRKENEERKRKEEAEQKKKEEEERKRKEEEEAERKRKAEEEKRKEEELKKKEEEERKRKEEEEAEIKRKAEVEEKKRKEEELKREEEERKRKEEEAERKRKEEEEKNRKEEEEKKRREEEAERKRKEEEAERKKKEEEERKEEEDRKAEEEKKKKEAEEAERKRKEEEEQKLAEEELKRKADEEIKKLQQDADEKMKKMQQDADDEVKRAAEELKKQQSKAEAEEELKKAESEMKKGEVFAAEEVNLAKELGKKVDDLFGLDKSGIEDNGKDVERDYVMVSPPHSPLQQVVAPPLMAVKKEEDQQEVVRKRQQVEEVMAVVSKDEHDSVSDLVNDLTTKQQKTTDFDKARALFIWLSSKDLKTLTFKNEDTGSDEEKLTGLQKGQTTYAQVYQTLCRNAGLDCELIHGYAKGVGYKPGMKFEGDNFRHSWNAVKVKGEWKLVDPNWGARHVTGKKEGSPEEVEASDENTVYQLDEYYFLPEAWELIHSHYPDEPEWQLREPITKEQFENLVLCKSPFFKHNLRIASHCESVIKVIKETEVKIQCPEEHKDNLVFIFTLSYADSLNAADDSFQGTPLGNFGMQRMVGNFSSVIIRPPSPGEYRLVIHVKDLSKPQRVPGKFYYSEVCEYGVLVTDAYPTPRPFPPCAHTSWGKGDSMTRYTTDLIPQASNLVIPTKNGIAEVKFTLKNKLRFLAKLKSATLNEVDRHVIHRVVDDEAVFTVRPPENGEYGLEIYANNKEKDGTTMHHIFQYLIVARDIEEKVEPFPQLPSTFLGAQGNFSNFGMEITSLKDPFIVNDGGNLSVEFKNTQPMKLMSQLICVSGGKQEDTSSYVLQNTTEDSISFCLYLPRNGTYKFTLFGLPADQASDNVPALYNCLIECRRGNANAAPFPKQYSQWKSSGVLVEPTNGKLTGSPSPTKFDLRIINARSVAVVVGDDWSQLAKNHHGNWTGEVDMSQYVGKQTKCVICANMDDNEATFSTLLEYSIAN